jgi:hypothetical protein
LAFLKTAKKNLVESGFLIGWDEHCSVGSRNFLEGRQCIQRMLAMISTMPFVFACLVPE